MNKQLKNSIINAKKVSAGEYKLDVKKTYHVSKSDKEHTAYVVKCANHNDIPLELSGAKYENTNILSARVVDDNDQLNTSVVMMSGHGTVDTAIESTHLGASNFVEKPLSIAKLLRTVEEALTEKKPQLNYPGMNNAASFVSIGHSDLLKTFRKELRRVASVDSAIMLIGEAGTGRSAFARYIHDISLRAVNPCVEIVSALLTTTNTEEQLLGKEGKDAIEPGFIEEAQEGTIIINGLADLNIRAQQLFHNILENGEYKRINGNLSLQDIEKGSTTEKE